MSTMSPGPGEKGRYGSSDAVHCDIATGVDSGSCRDEEAGILERKFDGLSGSTLCGLSFPVSMIREDLVLLESES